MTPLAVPRLQRVLPALARRVMVIDPGRRFLKVVVVDAAFGRTHVVHFETLDVAEDEDSLGEAAEQRLAALRREAGPHELVLVLPQYRAIAQVVDLPAGNDDERTALLREARRLSGLDETALAFDARRLTAFGRYQHPYWLTLCKREELDHLLARFAAMPEASAPAEGTRLAEVTTSAQALFAAAGQLRPPGGNAVLVDLRANNSVVAVVVGGQGVYTTTVPTGTRQLAEVLARERGLSLAAAEQFQLTQNPFERRGAAPGYAAALERWQAEVRLSIAEWLDDHPETGLTAGALPVYLCGTCAGQPHLLAFLNELGGLKFEAWEPAVTARQPWPMADYLVAYGAALLALGCAPRGISLLPPEARREHRLHRRLAVLQAAGLTGVLVAAVLLAVGLWQKQNLIGRKSRLTQRTQTALQTAANVDLLYRRLHGDYEIVYPLLHRQRETFETLQAFAALRAARTNDDFWYVLFADAASYAAGTTVPPAAVFPPLDAAATLTNLLARTNPPAPRREFVAELCIPREGEPLRRLLSDTVAALGRNPVFQRVDALPPERKREWVDPRVFVSNHVYAVVMEAAGRELELPAPPAPRSRPAVTNTPRRSVVGPRLERAGGQNP